MQIITAFPESQSLCRRPPFNRSGLETIIRVFHGGPVGMEAIAHTMNAALDTLVDEVEPFLLRSELVVRTPRGRKLTTQAYSHLGTQPPPNEPQLPLFK